MCIHVKRGYTKYFFAGYQFNRGFSTTTTEKKREKEGGRQSRDQLGTVALILTLVDVLHKNTLVLEHVTLALQVQLVIQMAINLLCLTVLAQQAAENTLTAHPNDLYRHACIRSTLALTETGVATLGASSLERNSASTGMDNSGLLDDQTVLNESVNALA